jgi:hypothetical protein
MKGFGGFGNSPAKQTIETMKRSQACIFPGKGKKLFEMSNERITSFRIRS